jgi:hypothetical protein
MPASRRLAAAALASALWSGACTGPWGGRCESPQCAQDARLASEVSRRIDEHASLRFFNLRVQASRGEVYLSGLVDTQMDRALAEDIAGAVPGVTRVYDGLELNGGSRYGFGFF